MATETAVDVVMPQMGVSVSEGTITKWLKREGEEVGADEGLLEISTDKVDTEVPSPGSGIVQKILVQEGETVEVGTVIALIAPAGAEVAPPASDPEAPAPTPEEAFEDLDAPLKRITAPDTPVPFSPQLEKAFIPQVDDVAAALRELAAY